MKMIMLSCLLFIFWGEPSLTLDEKGDFKFNGDIRQIAVSNDTVYVATKERLYQLNHDLTLVRSLTQRGIMVGNKVDDAYFQRVSEMDKSNATFSINVLLPFGENGTLISCGVTDNQCGYCELLDPKDISNVLYTEHIHVGSLWRDSRASVSFLVNVEKPPTETYILTATQQLEDKSAMSSCTTLSDSVYLHNTNNNQKGGIFSNSDNSRYTAIKREGKVEFVDGFQLGLNIYLFSNLPATDKSNKVRLIKLQGKDNKTETVESLRGATLRISDDATGSRLLASSVIPGGPPVLWSGVFSVGEGQTDTVLAVFDISLDLTEDSYKDPDFGTIPTTDTSTPPTPRTLMPKKVLFRRKYMTSVLAVRQKAWMVFFIGTEDGQLIKLAVDNRHETACPRVLYKTSDDRKVLPKIHLDPVDHKHVYMPFQNQIKRVPVSECSTYADVQQCWSAQDPYCVWCSSESRCTFEDDCQGSDWLSIPDDSQKKMVSYKVVKDSTGQVTLNIQTHLTVGQTVLSKFACHFSTNSGEPCRWDGPPPQFPRCICILTKSTLPAEGMRVSVKIRLGTTHLSEELSIKDCTDIKGPPTSALCRQCTEAGCGWSTNGCSWANQHEGNDSVCQEMESGINLDSRPEIFSISPSVVSFYGRNHAVLSGRNLDGVTRVRIQADMDCTTQESPVWDNTGMNLTFHIPSTNNKGVVKVCVVLPDGSCHGNAEINYQSSPSCIKMTPDSSWISGKRTITLLGFHLDFVEGVVHSHAMQEVKLCRDTNFQKLTYDTPAAYNVRSSTSVFLKVANETVECSKRMKYYPDPEFTSFTATRIGDKVRITIQKTADKLEMTSSEFSVWGVHGGKQYPCIMVDKETSADIDFFVCDTEMTPDATFQHLMIKYGDKTVILGSPALLHQVLLIVRILLIPCVFVVLVIIWRWQKKLTAERNKL